MLSMFHPASWEGLWIRKGSITVKQDHLVAASFHLFRFCVLNREVRGFMTIQPYTCSFESIKKMPSQIKNGMLLGVKHTTIRITFPPTLGTGVKTLSKIRTHLFHQLIRINTILDRGASDLNTT